ncbi:MAG: 50S ribosomal protein L24 [Alphaproteobacteria bacterium]
MADKFKLKKGDEVVVLAGKDRGKKGRIVQMLRTDGRALVEGLNMVSRHTKPSQTQAGGIVQKEASIDLSNLAIADPKDGSASRVGYKFLEDGRKVRVAKKSGEVIDV